MRVIGGSVRGRQLGGFSGREIRPTPDRVREALFSILYSKRGPFSGCTVLDLFAGSGALGIEALSRGARHAWFVESSRPAINTIRQNLARCELADRATVIMADLWRALPGLVEVGPFDLLFADPPYAAGHAPRLLQEVSRLGLLATDGLLCLETAPTDPVPDQANNLALLDRRRYGSTMLHFFQPTAEEPA
jgi:16S rRNA (guanine(966)-N(2))-methyltransferase RsmD